MDLYMIGKPSIIWITGASSGIGYALSAKLLAEGNIVIATARHGDKLQTLKESYSEKLHIYQLDVTDEVAVKEFCLQITEKFNHIDTMILNAGICEYIDWPDFDLKILHHNMNTNFWGMANCIAYGIKALQGSAKPYIVGMASSAAIIGLPRAEGYGSSKAAVRYLLQCLQVQYYNSNIDVSIVTPGFVKTELTSKNDFPMPFLISVDRAANIILSGMKKRKTEIKFPFIMILLLNFLSIIPDKVRNFILSKTVVR